MQPFQFRLLFLTPSQSEQSASAVSVQADELIHFVVLAGQRDEVPSLSFLHTHSLTHSLTYTHR